MKHPPSLVEETSGRHVSFRVLPDNLTFIAQRAPDGLWYVYQTSSGKKGAIKTLGLGTKAFAIDLARTSAEDRLKKAWRRHGYYFAGLFANGADQLLVLPLAGSTIDAARADAERQTCDHESAASCLWIIPTSELSNLINQTATIKNANVCVFQK